MLGEGNFSSERAICTEKGAYPWGEQFVPGESDLLGVGNKGPREGLLGMGRPT